MTSASRRVIWLHSTLKRCALISAVVFPGIAILLAVESEPRQSEVARQRHRTASDSHQQSETTLLIPLPSGLFDLGTVPKGGRQEARFWLRNPGDSAVKISNITTSCDCFAVDLTKSVVQPAEEVEAVAKVDLSCTPDFSGRLALEATGFAGMEKVRAFMIRV